VVRDVLKHLVVDEPGGREGAHDDGGGAGAIMGADGEARRFSVTATRLSKSAWTLVKLLVRHCSTTQKFCGKAPEILWQGRSKEHQSSERRRADSAAVLVRHANRRGDDDTISRVSVPVERGLAERTRATGER
jgi:hypothetical protein